MCGLNRPDGKTVSVEGLQFSDSLSNVWPGYRIRGLFSVASTRAAKTRKRKGIKGGGGGGGGGGEDERRRRWKSCGTPPPPKKKKKEKK